MSLKYCGECSEAVEQIVMFCPKCRSQMFVHQKPTSDSFSDRMLTKNRVEKSSRTQSLATEVDTVANQIQLDGNSSTGKTIDDLIRAQNRTTHAVRAFVRFLFIQLTGVTCAVFLWNLSLAFIDQQDCYANGSNCTGNAFLQFLAAVVLIGSIIWSSQAGWEELGKSNVG